MFGKPQLLSWRERLSNRMDGETTLKEEPSYPVPDVPLRILDKADNVVEISAKDFFAGKTIVVFCIPGAFSPICSEIHLPSYEEEYDRFIANGVHEVCCMSTNDPFVLKAWLENVNVRKIRVLSDGNAEFAKHLGFLVDFNSVGFGSRSERYSMLVRNGRILHIFLEEDATAMPTVSLPETMLNYIRDQHAIDAALEPSRTFVMLTAANHPDADEARELVASFNCRLHEVTLPKYLAASVVRTLSGRSNYPRFWCDGELIGELNDLRLCLARLEKCLGPLAVNFPMVEIYYEDKLISTQQLLNNKRVWIIGAPGAFTPVCSNFHLPGFEESIVEFTQAGVDEIFVLSVSKPHILDAWFQTYNFNTLKYIADEDAAITRRLGLELDLSSIGLGVRCKRFALLVENAQIQRAFVEADFRSKPSVTSAETLLNLLCPEVRPQERITLFCRRGCPSAEQIRSQLKSLSLTFKRVAMSDLSYMKFVAALGNGSTENGTVCSDSSLSAKTMTAEGLEPIVAVNGVLFSSTNAIRRWIESRENAFLLEANVFEPPTTAVEPISTEFEVPVTSLQPSSLNPPICRSRLDDIRRFDQFPEVLLHDQRDGVSVEFDLRSEMRNDNVIIFSCPSAFDIAVSDPLVLRFEDLFASFEASGVVDIFCVIPEDPFVARAWSQNLDLRRVKVISDGNGDFISRVIRTCRCPGASIQGNQFWMHVQDGVIKSLERDMQLNADSILRSINPYSLPQPSVCIVTKQGCRNCELAKSTLEDQNISFSEVPLPLGDAAYVLGSLSEKQEPSAPQIWMDGVLLGGLDQLYIWIRQRQQIAETLNLKKNQDCPDKFSDLDSIKIDLLGDEGSKSGISLSELMPSDSRVLLFGVVGAFEQRFSSTQLCRFEELFPFFQKAQVANLYCVCPNDEHVIREWFSQTEAHKIQAIADRKLSIYKWVGAFTEIKNGDDSTRAPLPFVTVMENKRIIFQKILQDEESIAWNPAEDVLTTLKPDIKIPDSVYLIIKSGCRLCEATEALLKKHAVQFDVLDLPSFKSVKAMNGITQASQPVPQIWVNGRCIGGYEECKQWISANCQN
eukprot:Gregarina_sp_Poly_1__1742@NODE_144_length_12899_cov_53_943501_g129_i0_p2_GENE_NODE_144_length_12899_cov_53_943501_g129_i0NODE_144_length_12899_cov_53_943501_g129_i0_p2_ORF_typecomplete_len1076_score162_64Redoxin/PF08534_10/8_5e22Redoxin/PF08534_10/6_2e13Redoxin/PF08534_10/1_4e06Redoxin/PF08534_10/3_3Glutaredoxin/PF00462_24/4_5e02Glutaredoxin/PF00462_24/5_1e02Glutaredoxin/PF00462_24/0_0047Glutaredoxin/PF00462_24/5_9e05DUF836/PF05768_14/12DUF836/PF05768_14/7DUF836/PF05768_14/1_8SH3BGR/PF04908_15/6